MYLSSSSSSNIYAISLAIMAWNGEHHAFMVGNEYTRKLKIVFFFTLLYDYIKVKLTTFVECELKALFSIATTPRYRGGRYSIPLGLPHFTLDPYLIILSKLASNTFIFFYFILFYFCLSLWYDLT